MDPSSSSADKLLIRNATETDAPVIYDFLCALEELPIDLTAFNSIFRQNLANPNIYYLVAEQASTVLGFISCHVQYLLHHSGKVGEIQELFVRSDARNQQIGKRLVDSLSELALQEGFINLEVTTNQKRLDTIRFYERESFQRTHVKLVKSITIE